MQEPDSDLLHRHLLGQTTTAEEQQVAAWRDHSQENEVLYGKFYARWQEMETLDMEADFNIEAGWRNLQDRLGFTQQDNVVPMQPKRNYGAIFALTAVAAVLVAGLLIFFNDPAPRETTVAMTVFGAQEKVDLPDGSTVWLDGGSELAYADGFGQSHRNLSLKGHGFFSVTKGSRPFNVRTEKAQVTVLGTEFDVWTGNDKTRVVVNEGRVAFQKRIGAGRVELGADEMGVLDEALGEIRVSSVTSGDFLLWKDGKLLFPEMPLHDITLDLERAFGQTIILEQTTLGSKTLTAAFDRIDLDTILEEICLTLDLALRREDDTYYISPR